VAARVNSPTNRRRVKAAERRAAAVELRVAGLTFDAIGKQLGITRQSVQKHLDAVLDAHAATISEHTDRLRALESHRLDVAAAAIWPRVLAADVRAQDTYLRNRARHAALLGLDLKPPDVTIDATSQVIVLPAWGEHPAQAVDGEARELLPPDAG
jgi:hypothetical protein